jgi:hypothetical protein
MSLLLRTLTNPMVVLLEHIRYSADQESTCFYGAWRFTEISLLRSLEIHRNLPFTEPGDSQKYPFYGAWRFTEISDLRSLEIHRNLPWTLP